MGKGPSRRPLGAYSQAHRRAIELTIEKYPSIEVAEIINEGYESGEIEKDGSSAMTPANVDQIYSRFKKQMRMALGMEGSK